jgi:predicted nuclease of predicted toxin-antitoxin system
VKIVVDSCIPQFVAHTLEVQHDMIWIGDWEKDPGDLSILQYAYELKRVVITLDKDYGELAILHQIPHAGIVRLVDLSLKQQVEICSIVLERYEQELLEGSIITASLKRIRIRPPDTH